MSGIVEGRVAIVTGGGRGIGREHAKALVAEGAKVVVNDLGCERDGKGSDPAVARAVVDEIVAAGGEAVAHHGDVRSVDVAAELVELAVTTYGRLDVMICNAGTLRDRMLVNMTEDEFDSVVSTHLKGTWAPAQAAARHWKARSQAGETVDGRLICTSSASGVFGNVGQTSYGAAKAGIASFVIIAAQELARYGVTVNGIAPIAITRLSDDLEDFVKIAEEYKAKGFDHFHPGTNSPTVVYLASAQSAEITGRVFGTGGNGCVVLEGWVNGPAVWGEGRLDPRELAEQLPGVVRSAAPNASFLGTRE